MKIGIIGTRGLPASYGAFDQFLNQFVNYCEEYKKIFFFYIAADSKNKNKNIPYKNILQFYFYRGRGFFILINNLISIIYFYFLGIRTFIFFGYGPVIFFPFLKLLKCKIICNVDGIEWKREVSLIKKIYFKFCEKLISIVNVNLIFDSIVVKKYYNITHKVNGSLIYYPSDFEGKKKIFFKKKTNKLKSIVVMRFLKENNIETIVNAFIKLYKNKNFVDKLYLIGQENEFYIRNIKPKIFNAKNIIFLGPIYDRNKLFKLWSSSDYYIHGHSVGGTNPTLIEALSLNLPVVAYNSSFNRAILGKSGIFFKSSDELIKIISEKKFMIQNLNIDYSLFKRDYINEQYINLIEKINN